jgi:hypothetical protein
MVVSSMVAFIPPSVKPVKGRGSWSRTWLVAFLAPPGQERGRSGPPRLPYTYPEGERPCCVCVRHFMVLTRCPQDGQDHEAPGARDGRRHSRPEEDFRTARMAELLHLSGQFLVPSDTALDEENVVELGYRFKVACMRRDVYANHKRDTMLAALRGLRKDQKLERWKEQAPTRALKR